MTGGEASDYTAAEPLMAIPPRSNRKVPEHPDYRRYRDRNRVERMFGKLEHQRRRNLKYQTSCLKVLRALCS